VRQAELALENKVHISNQNLIYALGRAYDQDANSLIHRFHSMFNFGQVVIEAIEKLHTDVRGNHIGSHGRAEANIRELEPLRKRSFVYYELTPNADRLLNILYPSKKS
jgi:hypothetical protein